MNHNEHTFHSFYHSFASPFFPFICRIMDVSHEDVAKGGQNSQAVTIEASSDSARGGQRQRRAKDAPATTRKSISWSEPVARGAIRAGEADETTKSTSCVPKKQALQQAIIERENGAPLSETAILTKQLQHSHGVQDRTLVQQMQQEGSHNGDADSISISIAPETTIRGLSYLPFGVPLRDSRMETDGGDVDGSSSNDGSSAADVMYKSLSSSSLFLRLWLTLDDIFGGFSFSECCRDHGGPIKCYRPFGSIDSNTFAKQNYHAQLMERGLIHAERILDVGRHIVGAEEKQIYRAAKERIVHQVRANADACWSLSAQSANADSLLANCKVWRLVGILIIDGVLKKLGIGSSPTDHHKSCLSHSSSFSRDEYSGEYLVELHPCGASGRKGGFNTIAESAGPKPRSTQQDECSSPPNLYWDALVVNAIHGVCLEVAESFTSDSTSAREQPDLSNRRSGASEKSFKDGQQILGDADIRALLSYFDYC